MQKSFVFYIVLFISSFNSFSQTEQKDSIKTSINSSKVRGPDINENTARIVIVMNGTLFIPQGSKYNLYFKKNKNRCWNYKNNFYIEGIELQEDSFNNLNLRQKDVVDSLTCYCFDYKDNDTLSCISTFYYYVYVKVPIILNGVKLTAEEKEIVLSKIPKEDLQEVRTKRNFWGKNIAIEINTYK
jgi:hypothetical protein